MQECEEGLKVCVELRGEYWVEYYRPLLFTCLGRHFVFGMNSTLKLPGYAVFDFLFALVLMFFFDRKTATDVNPHESPFVARHMSGVHPPRYVDSIVGISTWY